MIDLHAHVLPGLDDGPATVDDAVRLVRAAEEVGVATIVATPHVDHRFDVILDAIPAAACALRTALDDAGVHVELLSGGEIALDRLGELTSSELESLTLGDSRTLLVECPLRHVEGDFTAPVRRLLADGWGVLLAHPERSADFQADHGLLADLVARGAHAQITAAAIAGDFGPVPQATALAFLDAGLGDVVATDAHDTHRRMPTNERALAAAPHLEPAWDALTRATPAAILTETAVTLAAAA